ncbi:hypothetical protein [Pseudolactococcus insecticola]|uniref:Uncharacterized protein n=1 Tax=Pseudolactococcus insecticola TaxID=2709158 RepID=A0A6A0B714_9LACT|nr:hypothetical protein [Lactococcus insecticola]GFH40463.1 hypothetical protein Hs20B_08610 [Lactococcus insecticola]
MTDKLLDAKTRLEAANQEMSKASSEIKVALDVLNESEKNKAAAKRDFEAKTQAYSLAIQAADKIRAQDVITETEIIAADNTLSHAKTAYDAAKQLLDNENATGQYAFRKVIMAQAAYDLAKLDFDSAEYDYHRVLRERKMPIMGQEALDFIATADVPKTPTQATTDEPSLDFLMSFIKQNPLPDYAEDDDHDEVATTPFEKSDETPTRLQVIDPVSGLSYDPSTPFEDRPAVEVEPPKKGHITWDFIPKQKESEQK